MKRLLLFLFFIPALFMLPFHLFSGLRVLSEFEAVTTDNWLEVYTNGGARATNYLMSDRFEGNYSIEFSGSNLTNWNNAIWKFIRPAPENWSNYGKFVFAMKIKNVFTNSSDRNDRLNFGFTIKEPWGDPGWKGEVWNYFIQNYAFETNVWYLWETDITRSNAKNWNTRFDTWQDEDGGNDFDLNNNLFPPRGAQEVDIFFKTENTRLFNQKVRFDFMALVSVPVSTAARVTNYFPMNLGWNDAASNHPLYHVRIMTNITNSPPVVSALIPDAEALSSYSFNAHDYNLKPRRKYLWHLRSGYVVNSANGFTSGAYKKFNIDKSISSIPSSSSVTLWSYYSSWSVFSNKGIKPFNPALFSPADGSSNFGVANLDFKWEDLKEEGAELYIFALSSNRSFTRLITTRTLFSTNFILTGISNRFASGSNYYYSLRPGYTNYQASSPSWDNAVTNRFVFSYIAPSLVSPSDSATIYSNRAVFEWGNVFDGVTYTLEISSELSFSTVITSVSGLALSGASVSFSTNRFMNNRDYYWRVVSSCGLGTRYSSAFMFSLKIIGLEEAVSGGTESRIYPTVLGPSGTLHVLMEQQPGKTPEMVRIVFLDASQNIVAVRQYGQGEIPAGRIISFTPAEAGLGRGFYTAHAITRYSDNTVSRGRPFAVIVR